MGFKKDEHSLREFLEVEDLGSCTSAKVKTIHPTSTLYLQFHAHFVTAWALAQLFGTISIVICHRYIISESPSD